MRVGLFSRGDWIRTSDLLLPKQALYRAKLRPEKPAKSDNLGFPIFAALLTRPERLELPTF